MKALSTVYRSCTKTRLLEVILGTLECGDHFHKPTIINNDPDFSMGNPIVVCEQCVTRMRDVLGIEKDDSIPCHFQYFFRNPQWVED